MKYWNSLVLILLFIAVGSITSSKAFAAYGSAPTFAGSTTGSPSCSNTPPKMVWPFWAQKVGTNAVDLSWGTIANASSWTVAYGMKPKTYIYGISNFGNGASRSIRIEKLPAGTYYFAMRANNGCMPGPFSNEWKIVLGGGSTTGSLTTGLFNTTKPKTVTSPIPTKATIPTITQKAGIPLVSPRVPSPTEKPSFFGGVSNFFGGLFGKK